jgi:hypothetical protein
MKKLLVAFGDSWTFGSELHTPYISSWPSLVADNLEAELLNYSTPASSVGHLVVQLFNFINQIEKYNNYKIIFMIGLSGRSRYLSYYTELMEFINITPEAVYRTGNIKDTGQPPEDITEMLPYKGIHYRYVDSEQYSNFIVAQTLFLFQNFTKLNNIDSIYFSYFDYPNLSEYKNLMDEKLLYPETITKTLTGAEYSIPEIRKNVYFENKLFHPNELGHKKIAEILLNFYENNKNN